MTTRWEDGPLLGWRCRSDRQTAFGAALGLVAAALGAESTHSRGRSVASIQDPDGGLTAVSHRPFAEWRSSIEPLVQRLPITPSCESFRAIVIAYAAARVLLAGVANRARGAATASLDARRTWGDLVAGFAGHPAAELIPCSEGWVVVRWRNRQERDLLEAICGGSTERLGVDAIEAAARAQECRLLVAPVLPPEPFRPLRFEQWHCEGRRPRALHDAHVLDWSSLWAGPWATGELARRGASVVRVEGRRRPDGLLQTSTGRRLWRQLNRRKDVRAVDLTTTSGRQSLQDLIRKTDVALVGQPTRVREALGLSPHWIEHHAPQTSEVCLVALDAPRDGVSGLGEHGAAAGGLLWRGPGEKPEPPYAWADPLAGALSAIVAAASLTDRRRGSWTVSLENAARLPATVASLAESYAL